MSSGVTRQPRGGALGTVGAMDAPPSASTRDPFATGRRRAMGTTSQVLAALAAIVLATPGLALAGGASGQAAQAQDPSQDAQTAPVRTAKERLSGKAADAYVRLDGVS